MSNINDYLRWRGDLSFTQAPLCPVDFLIFAELVYARYEEVPAQGIGMTLGELKGRLYPEGAPRSESLTFRNREDLWQLIPGCPRFAGVRLQAFSAHFAAREEVQFAAARFETPAGEQIIAFRGTDATLVGWKEDFNMSFETPVPSQLEAVEYLCASRAAIGEGVYLTGHSKGGNLALYAASMCPQDVSDCIRGVYVFDGPGVSEDVLSGEGFARVKDRLHAYIPESSIIGLLMETCEKPTIVVSERASLQQHDPFYWHVEGTRFVEAEDTTLSSRFIDRTLHGFLRECDVPRRRAMVDTLYQLLSLTGAQRIGELPRGAALHMMEIRRAVSALSADDRAALTQMMKTLVGSGGESAKTLLGEWWLSRAPGKGKEETP